MNNLNTSEVKQYVEGKKNGVIINVLSEKSHQEGHIPNSLNVPLDSANFLDQVENLIGGKESEVVVYCASKDCDASEKAARNLESHGFKNVNDYVGGIKEWKDNDNSLMK